MLNANTVYSNSLSSLRNILYHDTQQSQDTSNKNVKSED